MTEQLTTFYIGHDLYGIEVMKVQEVTGQLGITQVPLAPKFVRGLINLRGQIATALGLRELFELRSNESADHMSVVCKLDGNLVSLLVDSIGEVIEVKAGSFEGPPETVPLGIRKYVKGICKTNETLLSVLDLDRIAQELSTSNE